MKKILLLTLAIGAGVTLARLPGPESYESKWLLPGLEPQPVFADSTHDYDVRFYRLDLDLPMTTGSMSAHCGIWLASEVPSLDSAVLDFVNLTCDSVRHADSALDFYDSYSFLTVYFDEPLARGDSIYIDIWYRRAAGQNLGFYWYLKGSGQGRNHTVCYSITQPEDSRYWFPCWDQPWDKAEQGCQVSITLPDSFRACANGLLDSVTTPSSGRKTWWWTHRYAVPSYLVNFAASVYKEITQWFEYAPGESMLVRHWVWPEDSVDAVTAFAKMVDMLEFYSDSSRFGMYPFVTEKYGQVAVYPFNFGGMEHQTMTTIHRYWIQYANESGIAHELAHMWFGDWLTCFTWKEIWLNEGSASYLDPLWMYDKYGRQHFLDDMASYREDYFDSDQRRRRPLYDPPMSELFDWGHTYCKAAWVNHMTRYVEGDTVFGEPGVWWLAERAYLDSFALGNATTEDRKLIHENLAGIDLDWFYDEWVFQAGYPDYTVNWFPRQTADGWQVVIDIGQDNGAQAPQCFHMPVEVLVGLSGGGDTLLRVAVESNPQRRVFDLPAEPTGITFDPGKWLLERHDITSGIENEIRPGAGVSRPVLHQVPSPSAGAVSISYSLPHALDVDLSVLDAAGRQVRTLDRGRRSGDRHALNWDRRGDSGREVAAGLYFIRLRAGDRAETRKLVLR